MDYRTTATRTETLTTRQIKGFVSDLLLVCDTLMARHGIDDKDNAMMHMILLSFATGAIIGSGSHVCPPDQAISAALKNIRKGVSFMSTADWLPVCLGTSGSMH